MFTSLFTLTGPVAPSGAGASTPLHCLRETPSPGASPGAHAAAAMPRRRGRGAMGKRPSRAGLRTEHSHPAVRSPEHAEDGTGSSIPPTAETINKNPVHPIGKEEITAPCGTGSLRRIRPQRSLRNVDDDHGLLGHDRHADAVAPATDADHEDPITSCRDGSGCTDGLRSRDALGLPAYRRSRITWDSGIKLSSDADYTNHEALRVQNSGSNAPIPQGLSPFSSACLYLRTQSSTPWAILANSLLSTFDCRYSITSEGRETVREIFLEPLGIEGKSSKLLLNKATKIEATISNLLIGALQHGRESTISESSVRQLDRNHRQAPGDRGPADGAKGQPGLLPGAAEPHQARDHGPDGELHGLGGCRGRLDSAQGMKEAAA